MSTAVYGTPVTDDTHPTPDSAEHEDVEEEPTSTETAEQLNWIQENDESTVHQMTDLEEEKWDQSETTEHGIEDIPEKDITVGSFYNKSDNEPMNWSQSLEGIDENEDLDTIVAGEKAEERSKASEEEEPHKADDDENRTLEEDQLANEYEPTLSDAEMSEQDLIEEIARSESENDQKLEQEDGSADVYMDIKPEHGSHEQTGSENLINVEYKEGEFIDEYSAVEEEQPNAAESNDTSEPGGIEVNAELSPSEEDAVPPGQETTEEDASPKETFGAEMENHYTPELQVDEEHSIADSTSAVEQNEDLMAGSLDEDQDDEHNFHEYDVFSHRKMRHIPIEVEGEEETPSEEDLAAETLEGEGATEESTKVEGQVDAIGVTESSKIHGDEEPSAEFISESQPPSVDGADETTRKDSTTVEASDVGERISDRRVSTTSEKIQEIGTTPEELQEKVSVTRRESTTRKSSVPVAEVTERKESIEAEVQPVVDSRRTSASSVASASEEVQKKVSVPRKESESRKSSAVSEKEEQRKVSASSQIEAATDSRRTSASFVAPTEEIPRKVSTEVLGRRPSETQKTSVSSIGEPFEEIPRKISASEEVQKKVSVPRKESESRRSSAVSENEEQRKVSASSQIEAATDSRRTSASFVAPTEEISRKVSTDVLGRRPSETQKTSVSSTGAPSEEMLKKMSVDMKEADSETTSRKTSVSSVAAPPAEEPEKDGILSDSRRTSTASVERFTEEVLRKASAGKMERKLSEARKTSTTSAEATIPEEDREVNEIHAGRKISKPLSEKDEQEAVVEEHEETIAEEATEKVVTEPEEEIVMENHIETAVEEIEEKPAEIPVQKFGKAEELTMPEASIESAMLISETKEKLEKEVPKQVSMLSDATAERREPKSSSEYRHYVPLYDRRSPTAISASSMASSYYSDTYPRSSSHYTSVFDYHVSTGAFSQPSYASLRRSVSRERMSYRLPRTSSVSRFTSYHDYEPYSSSKYPDRNLVRSTSFSRFMDYYSRVKEGMKRTFSRDSLYTPRTYHNTYTYSSLTYTPSYPTYGYGYDYDYGYTPRRNIYRTYSRDSISSPYISSSTYTRPRQWTPFISRVSSYYSKLTSGYSSDRFFNPFSKIKKLYRPWKFDHSIL